jgi:hypothetical protein
MIDLNTARNMALALPGTVEMDHFGIPSFRVKDRIFSTLWIHDNKMMVKLSLIDQSVFSAFDSSVIYPVPNKYGPMGYTLFELATVRPEMLEDALKTAYQSIIDKTKKKKKRI